MPTDTSVHAKICALRADLADNLIDRAEAIDAAGGDGSLSRKDGSLRRGTQPGTRSSL
jgi:hypothetical protein